MEEVKRKWDLLTKEKRNATIQKIVDFFNRERDEKIGVIAAEDMLDFFLQNVGEEIYNQGVEDSKELLRRRFEDLDLDLSLLLKKEET